MSTGERPAPDPRAWEGWPAPPGVPDPELLLLLTTDAAQRAAAMLAGATDEAVGQRADETLGDPLVDAVRLLATAAGAGHVATTVQLTGIPEDDVRRLVLAYRHGGAAGVAAAREPMPGSSEDLASASDEVRRRRTIAIGELSIEAGEITDPGGGVRLRLGPDGRWHPFTLARGQWWPAAGANASAGAAYQAAVRARSLRRASS